MNEVTAYRLIEKIKEAKDVDELKDILITIINILTVTGVDF